jgi:hypothetical protein
MAVSCRRREEYLSLLLPYNCTVVGLSHLRWYVTNLGAYLYSVLDFLQTRVQNDVRTQVGYIPQQTGLLCAFWAAPCFQQADSPLLPSCLSEDTALILVLVGCWHRGCVSTPSDGSKPTLGVRAHRRPGPRVATPHQNRTSIRKKRPGTQGEEGPHRMRLKEEDEREFAR